MTNWQIRADFLSDILPWLLTCLNKQISVTSAKDEPLIQGDCQACLASDHLKEEIYWVLDHAIEGVNAYYHKAKGN